MHAFFHIAAFYDHALSDDSVLPDVSVTTLERRYDKYFNLSDPEYRNHEAQARYDAQWGTHNGYSELDYQLAEREY